jgi:hypothetical protein
LVILAAGEWTPEAIAEGYSRVQALLEEIHHERSARLIKLGFSAEQANTLSALHTRKFM